MKILLLGKDGQVGGELQRSLAPLGELIAAGRNEADLEHLDGLQRIIESIQPDVLVNAAAYTAVDQAELEPDRAHAVNAQAVDIMARQMARRKGWLIHFSTDYVFGAGSDVPHLESDPTAPQNVYGESKLGGELAIRDAGGTHLIFRTSWVYSQFGGNFANSILRNAKTRDTLSVVDDQIGAPTSAALIADVTALALHQVFAAQHKSDQLGGTYHLAASGETSWFGYAKLLLERAQLEGIEIRALPDSLSPVPTSAFPARASRPLNSRLDTKKLREAFQLHLPEWQTGVKRFVSQMKLSGML